MHCRDREGFAQALLVFAQASQLDIPPGSAELYWVVLQLSPWTLVERGLQRAMRRRWSAFPPPSAIAELIEEVIAQLAERRWMQLAEAVREVGPHHSLLCDDPAWAEALRIMFVDWPTTCRRLREAEGAERTMVGLGFFGAKGKVMALRQTLQIVTRGDARCHGYSPLMTSGGPILR